MGQQAGASIGSKGEGGGYGNWAVRVFNAIFNRQTIKEFATFIAGREAKMPQTHKISFQPHKLCTRLLMHTYIHTWYSYIYIYMFVYYISLSAPELVDSAILRRAKNVLA